MVKKSKELMQICREGLPENSQDYIPDIVHDFIWDYWEELKDLLNED